MDIVYSFARRARHTVAVFGSLLALVVATLVPGLASAAQLTERSIALSSSSENASNVTYTINFTAASTAGALLVQFCSNPLVGQTCTHVGGFDASSAAATAAATTAGVTAVSGTTDTVLVTDSSIAAAANSIELSGIHNPTTHGPLYARILTFDNATHAGAYDPSTSSITGLQDSGGAAISITQTIGVSASVQESMTFCVSGATITTTDCSGTTTPTLKLGETQGTTTALDSGHVSSGNIYTYLATNALSGAVVSLKTSAPCGGLLLAGDTSGNCYIAPALTAGITAGNALFGLKTNTSTAGTGTYRAYDSGSGAYYNDTTYKLAYVVGDASGVTSPYGDKVLDTNSAPLNNGKMALTFGASVSNSTPAGNYSADLSLIATGTF
jgi:hypothetical protein